MSEALSVSVADLRDAQVAGAQVVDVRVPVAYTREHIPESINVPYTRNGFAQQAAFYLKQEAPVVLVSDNTPLADFAAQELNRAGFTVQGLLDGGIAAWKQAGGPLAAVGQITADELSRMLQEGRTPRLIDVREAWEFNSGHIEGSEHIPLSQFGQRYGELQQDEPMVFVCASGARSGEAVQFLYRLGYRQVSNLVGGMAAWLAGGRRG
ncbi:MAG: rhodanese-like domain-containing protein [Thermaerobacter sp.]|nr:rhodanese-like domain-containing protein [Thermaerobacter sp.]